MKIEENIKKYDFRTKKSWKNAKYNFVGKGDNKSTVSGKSNVTGNSTIHTLKKDLQKK